MGCRHSKLFKTHSNNDEEDDYPSPYHPIVVEGLLNRPWTTTPSSQLYESSIETSVLRQDDEQADSSDEEIVDDTVQVE